MKWIYFKLVSIFFLFLFFAMGGNLTFHPTTANAQQVAVTNIPTAWIHNKQRIVQYNGTNFFIFYSKGSTEIYSRSASTIAGLASASEVLLTGGHVLANSDWDVYWIDDTKFDIVYQDSTTTTQFKVLTCPITSGTTIGTCTGPATGTATTAPGSMTIIRTPSANRIWVAVRRGTTGAIEVYDATTTGDAASGMAFTKVGGGSGNLVSYISMVAYGLSDKVIAVVQNNGTNNSTKDIESQICTTASCTGVNVVPATAFGTNLTKMGNLIRISDTDFRFVYVDISTPSNLKEAKFDGNTTWTAIFATIDSGGGQKNPSLFYDRTSGDEYVFYADSSTPNHIQRYYKLSGSSWGVTKTEVDTGEATANSFPITQMHEAPTGSSRTVPRELPWCYRNANGSNFNIVCGDLTLASAGSLGLTAPSSTTLSSVTVAETVQSSTGSLGTTTASDSRSGNPGWGLTVSCSDFTASTHTIGISNLTINPNNGTLAVVSGSGTGVTAGSSHTFTNTSDAATIMTATLGNGNGQYTINPGLSLAIPVGSYAGNYTATITETLL